MALGHTYMHIIYIYIIYGTRPNESKLTRLIHELHVFFFLQRLSVELRTRDLSWLYLAARTAKLARWPPGCITNSPISSMDARASTIGRLLWHRSSHTVSTLRERGREKEGGREGGREGARCVCVCVCVCVEK